MSTTDHVSPNPVLKATGLGYQFTDGVWAFRTVNYSLFPGEIAVLAGRNGAGKTFLAKHLAGLIEPTEGTVHVSGLDIRLTRGSRAEKVGYLFQDVRLQIVGDTILDDALFGPTNLGLSPTESMSRAKNALFACGLADRENDFVHKLSGGETRRLAMAGLLAMMPKVVILDEPFANLDLSGVRSILDGIRRMASDDIAVLIVTHEIEKVLGLANFFSILDNGRIVLSGKPDEVLAQGIEAFGLRNPFHNHREVQDLTWLD